VNRPAWSASERFAKSESHARPSFDNDGGYMLIDDWTNGVVAGARYHLDLDGVEEYITWRNAQR
jgi:hypothetical protein